MNEKPLKVKSFLEWIVNFFAKIDQIFVTFTMKIPAFPLFISERF